MNAINCLAVKTVENPHRQAHLFSACLSVDKGVGNEVLEMTQGDGASFYRVVADTGEFVDFVKEEKPVARVAGDYDSQWFG